MRMTHTRACLAILAITLLSISSAWALTPAEVLGKAEAKYKSLTSYSATGKTISIVRAAEVNADKVLDQGFQKPHNLTHTFTIKLGRPDLYLIQSKGTLTETHQNIVVNKPAEKAAYRHPVPAGLRPSASPF